MILLLSIKNNFFVVFILRGLIKKLNWENIEGWENIDFGILNFGVVLGFRGFFFIGW